MKLLRAKFKNFRLLRDLEFEFSCDVDKKLTVIRAANESGKTTILHALQWALYGDVALPNKGVGFRLHPIDWNISDGKRVPITATVEFEVTTSRRMIGNDNIRETRRRYRLIRSVFEDMNSQVRRNKSTVKLFELNDIGASPIGEPESWVNEELPPELREVFFTDGDRALSFIQADVALSAKRDRVRSAIRSLLGLGIIEKAVGHVRKSEMEANKKVKQLGGGSELNRVASTLDTIKNDRERFESDLQNAKEQFEAFDEMLNKIEYEIEEALRKGDQEKLRKDFEQIKRQIKQLNDDLVEANKEHSRLFRSQKIATGLLEPILDSAFEKLGELRDQGKIPNTTIPVLQDRLSEEICICGETLKPDDEYGYMRRAHIQKLIDNSRNADEIQEIITRLYFNDDNRPQTDGNKGASTWIEDFKKVVERREDIQNRRDEAGRKYRALEQQLESLGDTDIQGLRETRLQYKNHRDSYLQKRSEIGTQLEALRRDHDNLEIKRDRLLSQQQKGARIHAELKIIQDVTKVLQNAYQRITNEELHKVSELMNRLFLEMIGADPEQGTIIQHTEISREFDIIVYGPNNRTLDPDRDLNGASRRALTLAFILALTKVSKVQAPNVIDTPLGMTSGYVKRSILRTAVRESTQIVLFLTHDEIAGCEDIIDEEASVVFTLTNPAHYPKMLINDPGVAERKILRCTCDHQIECQLCQRRTDVHVEPEAVS